MSPDQVERLARLVPAVKLLVKGGRPPLRRTDWAVILEGVEAALAAAGAQAPGEGDAT